MPITNEQRERHLKIKTWNEYVIDYYALRIEKRVDADYSRIEIYQGKFCVYKDLVYQSYSLTPAQMHKNLQSFLLKYISVIKPFGIVYDDANFKPPTLDNDIQCLPINSDIV